MAIIQPLKSSDSTPTSGLSRRAFLRRAAQTATALFVAPTFLNGCGSSRESFVSTGNPQTGLPLDSLRARLEGNLLTPSDAGFAQAVRPWNLRYTDKVPAALARCASLEDIVDSLDWSEDNGVPFAARSGGHSYSAFSSSSGLMIDLSGLRSVEMDPATGRVKLGPGARNSTVYDALRPLSRSVTHGRCLEVGVSGLCLGGGIGFNMRLHGLTCDQLVETEILLADRQVLTLNENQNSDLFWACRGAGGGNFGIHTSFTFQTFPVDRLTFFRIDWTDNLDELFPLLMDLLPTAPRELGVKLSITVTRGADGQNRLKLELLGQLRGPIADVLAFFEPAFNLVEPSADDVRELSYWEAQDQLGEDGAPQFSYERSHLVNNQISRQGLNTILSYLRAWPGMEGLADWKMFLTGGAISDVPSNATAYVHRQALGISSVELEWHTPQSDEVVNPNLEWVDEFHRVMAAYTSGESYQNFIDANQTDYLRAYYGSNLERLVEVKRTYDPNNVFNYPQSIPVSL